MLQMGLAGREVGADYRLVQSVVEVLEGRVLEHLVLKPRLQTQHRVAIDI